MLLALPFVKPVGEGDKAATVADPTAHPGMTFRDMTYVGRSKGEKQWELFVSTVYSGKDSKIVTLDNLRKGTVFRDGEPYLYVSADGGTYYVQQDNFVIKGHVVLQSKDGDTLRSDQMQWNPTTRQVVGPDRFEAKVKGMSFTANRFSVDIKGEWILASGDVLLVKENGDRLSGQDLIYSLKDDTWEMQGQVDLTIQL